jgi:hypothetical protein
MRDPAKKRRALIERYAHDRNGGIERLKIGANGRAQETRDADERPIDAGFTH